MSFFSFISHSLARWSPATHTAAPGQLFWLSPWPLGPGAWHLTTGGSVDGAGSCPHLPRGSVVCDGVLLQAWGDETGPRQASFSTWKWERSGAAFSASRQLLPPAPTSSSQISLLAVSFASPGQSRCPVVSTKEVGVQTSHGCGFSAALGSSVGQMGCGDYSLCRSLLLWIPRTKMGAESSREHEGNLRKGSGDAAAPLGPHTPHGCSTEAHTGREATVPGSAGPARC